MSWYVRRTALPPALVREGLWSRKAKFRARGYRESP